jgi:Type I phosphodiesterase / nucleotide pyrophosphatase
MGRERRLPDYGGLCFDALPATIEGLFSGRPGGLLDGRYDRVVLVYFDAFGWRFFERHGGNPLFRDAQAIRLTSQFPSTTAVHSTTINTGLPLAQHGVYEWFVYEPTLDRLIAPLPFSFAGDHERETLHAAGFAPSQLFPAGTFYRRLEVPSFTTLPGLVALSSASRYLLDGATVHGFEEPAEGARWLASELAARERAYATIYLPALDALMHLEGPDSPSIDPLIEETLTALQVADWPEGTLLLLTADHGCTAISPARTTYVNLAWPELARHLATGADGRPLAPAGSARDLFLHVLPGRLDEVAAQLGRLLEGKADVERVDSLVDDGLFGPDVSETLRSRLANLVVLPFAGEAVYWLEPGRFEQTFLGQHGGLSPDEMDIPLVSWAAR